jgi:hypothetical protein
MCGRNLILINILIVFALLICADNAAADSTHVSFHSLNSKNYYTSFSFGMGLSYGNNPSLKNFIQYRIPDYNYLTRDEQLQDFSSGLDFFVGIEKQISKNFSVKAEYSYFLKSYNVNLYPQYNFSYYSHLPYIMLYYIIPQEYSFLKIGIGTGYVFSKFNLKEFGLESNYTSGGFGLKAEVILNAQIGKSVAGYISGNISNTFLSNLKDNSGKELLTNGTNETVNLNSFNAGIRLGVEIFFF